ncbi:hypothetical protein RhiXN_08424 [Rhizoctonia solani]|uniref:Extensin-like n=1 Tax=Rhizoctonia solani TaxID=456999 RepID=A0A8H8P2F6_9AGAM|nr:uncharacterized protein RhiXN_08424 [Rhizoctonia solani]QRW23388.1 hypothetical protein RhiXN_08424 [Rhizoctonia solani]
MQVKALVALVAFFGLVLLLQSSVLPRRASSRPQSRLGRIYLPSLLSLTSLPTTSLGCRARCSQRQTPAVLSPSLASSEAYVLSSTQADFSPKPPPAHSLEARAPSSHPPHHPPSSLPPKPTFSPPPKPTFSGEPHPPPHSFEARAPSSDHPITQPTQSGKPHPPPHSFEARAPSSHPPHHPSSLPPKPTFSQKPPPPPPSFSSKPPKPTKSA